MTLRLRAPDDVRQGDWFTLEVIAEGTGPIGGYELTLEVPEGAFDVVRAARGDLLGNAYLLGPMSEDGRVRMGGYARQAADLDGSVVLARLVLFAREAGEADLEVHHGQVIDGDGGEYRVTANGVVVSPDPWVPTGVVFLPRVLR